MLELQLQTGVLVVQVHAPGHVVDQVQALVARRVATLVHQVVPHLAVADVHPIAQNPVGVDVLETAPNLVEVGVLETAPNLVEVGVVADVMVIADNLVEAIVIKCVKGHACFNPQRGAAAIVRDIAAQLALILVLLSVIHP